MSESSPLIEVRGICKAFPGVQALQDVNLVLNRGQVLAVVGENGAGKSTLMKIIAGVYDPDAGEIRLEGKPVVIGAVDRAQDLGIVLIHQELNLAENLDIAGNIFLGREPTWGGPLRMISRRIAADSEPILHRIGLNLSPRTRVSDLPIGQQQMVEIARALSLKLRVLIMDEPTSSLTQRETERLYEVIRDLKRDGISVLYISHRLKEVEIIADRVTVLRDGRNAGELEKDQINHEAMVRLMVGREMKQFFQRSRSQPIEHAGLEVRGSALDAAPAGHRPEHPPGRNCRHGGVDRRRAYRIRRDGLRHSSHGQRRGSPQRAIAANSPAAGCDRRRHLPRAGRSALARTAARAEHSSKHQPAVA